MLDAHQLNVFLTAAKTMNFTAAARQLHMTQPSVSQHIQALEQYFGTALFIRTGRHLRLTDAGSELMVMAEDMVFMSQHIDERMESLKGEVHGHLIVGCSTTIGKYVLPFLLSEFMNTHPRVSASCLVAPRQDAMQRLLEGEVHLALASADEFVHDAESCSIITDRVVLIVPLEHPWAERDSIAVDELRQANFIVREEGSGTRRIAEAALIDAGFSPTDLRTILTLGNSEAIALAVQEGIGAAFISQMVVARLVPDKVAQIPIEGVTMKQDICIGQNNSRPATTAQSAFWDFVTDPANPILQKLDAFSEHARWPELMAMPANGGSHLRAI